MKHISIEDYHNLKDKALTIDVRTPSEVKMLENFLWAKNIPIDTLLGSYQEVLPDKEQFIVTVCNAGNRSGEAARFLNQNGYENAYVLDGGIYGYFRRYKK